MSKIEVKASQIDNLNITYRILGDPEKARQILLILHGWNTTGSDIWKDFINTFLPQVETNELCVIAPDMPGFGQSQPPQEVWKAENYAEFLIKFADTVCPNQQSLSLLGHSFGGAVAIFMSCKYQERRTSATHLFLVAPAIIRLTKSDSQTLVQKITKLGKKFIKNEFLKRVWYRLIGSPDYARTKGIMQEIFRQVVTQDLVFILKNIRTKTTIIWGDKDTYTPIWQSEIIQFEIKGSKLIILPDINHGIHIYAAAKLHHIVLKDLDLVLD